MFKTIAWFLVLLAGFGLMLFSYRCYDRVANPTPWTDAIIFAGKGEPAAGVEGFDVKEARVRFLPMAPALRQVAKDVERSMGGAASAALRSVRKRVLFYQEFARDFAPDMLASGRLPRPGAAEVLAGFSVADKGEVTVGGQVFRVVGVLGRAAAVFANAYVLPFDEAYADLFNLKNEDVLDAYILRMPPKDAGEKGLRKRLAEAFPRREFTPLMADLRVEPGPFYLYLAGMALMLAGGSALFIRLYVFLADVARGTVLGPPFEAVRRRRGLLAAMHGVYFGPLLLFAVVAYYVPEVQAILVGALQEERQSGSGPLGLAGKAYGSGSIAWAAAVTVLVNFLLGTLVTISIPSAVVPGVGALVLWLRPVVVGLALAPSTMVMSRMMLAHSWTILVEMEAYILAAFFAVMIPLYMIRAQEGPTVLRRYGRAMLLNLQGLAIAVGLLVIAAIYEAVEVILQMR